MPNARYFTQNSEDVNTMEKFLKEIKSVTLLSTQMIRKQNSPVADMQEVSVVQIDHINHNIPQAKARSKPRLSSIL